MRIALCQIAATTDPDDNLRLVADGIARAARAGATLAVFPEATMARFGASLADLAEPLDGPWAASVRRMADDADIAVAVGMFTPTGDGRVANTLLFTGRGVEAHYEKIHLFDAFGHAESDTIAAGDTPVTVSVDGVTIGLAICYDVRFPGLYTSLAANGARVILTSASWGGGPGKREQWELLTRARALDSTSWILACDQADPESIGATVTGNSPRGIGYSLVSAPLGTVHSQLGQSPDVLVVDVDPAEADATRQALPVLNNTRDTAVYRTSQLNYDPIT